MQYSPDYVHMEEVTCPALMKLKISFDIDRYHPSILMGCSQSLETFELRIGQLIGD